MQSMARADRPRVGLFVKNGIGLGHLRRAVLVGQALTRLGEAEPVVLSQATSLDLLLGRPLRAVNLPLLHRLPSNTAEAAFRKILSRVVDHLRLDLLVEDTYPDPLLDELPGLASLPRAILVRRIDPVSFDALCRSGCLDAYDAVLLAQSRVDFEAERHTARTRRAVFGSGRFSFVGPIYHHPSEHEVDETAGKYRVRCNRLVVFSAGGGGDHFDDGYCDSFFRAAAHTARQVADRDVRFVLVYGPYYPGLTTPLPPNAVAVAFEPGLAALLRGADVVVIRPGHNVLSEALAGRARVVVVPGISWMESQQTLADRIASRPGVHVAPLVPEEICERVRVALTEPRRSPEQTSPQCGGAEVAARTLAHLANTKKRPADAPRWRVCLLLRLSPAGQAGGARIRSVLGDVGFIGDAAGQSWLPIIRSGQAGTLEAAYVDGGAAVARDAGGKPPDPLRLVICRQGELSWTRDWLRYHRRLDDVAVAEAVVVTGHRAATISHAISRTLRRQPMSVITLDLTGIENAPQVVAIAGELGQWLRDGRITLVTVEELSRYLSDRLLVGTGDRHAV